jgi:hypothetical protein
LVQGVNFRVLASLIVLLCPPRIFAQERRKLDLDQKDLTVLGLTIGSSSRAQVESKLGKTKSFKLGAGEDSDEAVCYRSNLRDDDTILIFHFGALGGWSDVTQISVSEGRELSLHATTCSPNATVSRNLAFLRGLRLGASAADVIRVLGRPSRASKRKLSYYVSHPCPPKGPKSGETEATQTQSCVVVDSVDAKFSLDDQLVYVSFYHFVDQ